MKRLFDTRYAIIYVNTDKDVRVYIDAANGDTRDGDFISTPLAIKHAYDLRSEIDLTLEEHLQLCKLYKEHCEVANV